MDIRWDENKRIHNLKDHKLDLRDAWMVFNGLEWTAEDHRFQYSERRFNTIGFLGDRVVKLTYCYDYEVLRVISLRKATRNEALQYASAVRERNGLGRF